jgi:hypothetical protein
MQDVKTTQDVNTPPDDPSAEGAGQQAVTLSGVKFLPPLKPRRRLLIVMSVLLAAWAATLLAIYFTTVYPAEHPVNPATESVANP